MNKNINRIIRELENDPAIQAMHRDNIEKRRALRERRRALMLARMHGRYHNVIANIVVGPDDERRIKIEAIKRGIWEKYNGDTVKALLGYIPHLVASGFNGKFNQEFDNLFHEAINEIWEERRREEEARRKILQQEEEKEEKEVYILSNGKKTNDFLEWAQDRIDARKAAESGK